MFKNKPTAKIVWTIVVVLAAAITILAVYQASGPSGAVPRFFSWSYWQEGGQNASRSEVFRNLALALAGFIGLGFGIWRAYTAYLQTRVAQQGHITDRFSNAVEQLGHDNVSVRIGGLYALKRIAEDSPERDHLAVMDVISNFVRHTPYAEAQKTTGSQYINARQVYEEKQREGGMTPIEELISQPTPQHIDCPDIIVAVEIIQFRTGPQLAAEIEQQYIPNLPRARLDYLRLTGASFEALSLPSCSFIGANLMAADLTGANLKGAYFAYAWMTDAKFVRATLTNANLSDARLPNADFTSAQLTGAYLRNAEFSHAILAKANLKGAKLMYSDLKYANLAAADFTGADLSGADLTGANLAATNLTDADLSGADLTGTNLATVIGLTQDQIGVAIYNLGFPPIPPPGLTLPAQPVEAEEPEPDF